MNRLTRWGARRLARTSTAICAAAAMTAALTATLASDALATSAVAGETVKIGYAVSKTGPNAAGAGIKGASSETVRIGFIPT